MASEARLWQEGDTVDVTPDAAMIAGEVFQLPDGRAAVTPVAIDASTKGAARVEPGTIFIMPKTTGIVLLKGGQAWWDHSANKVHYKKVNDRDFYLGRVAAGIASGVISTDAASADTEVMVAININPPYDIDVIQRDAALSVATGTAAAGGFGLPVPYGSALGLSLTATNEAQCVDILSVDRFAIGANAIAEFVFRIGANGSTNAVDLNIGVANGTHTADADSITESVFIHIDGNSTAINAESDDGTTEVAATDTTLTFTAGSAVANRVEVWMDMRDPADVQIYVNGALVLGSTVFKIDAATGPLGLLAHIEKTSGTATAGPVYVDVMRARYQQ